MGLLKTIYRKLQKQHTRLYVGSKSSNRRYTALSQLKLYHQCIVSSNQDLQKAWRVSKDGISTRLHIHAWEHPGFEIL
jgi:hypothetical protein